MPKLVGYEVTLCFHKYMISLYATLQLNWPSALYLPRNLENIDVHACDPLRIGLESDLSAGIGGKYTRRLFPI